MEPNIIEPTEAEFRVAVARALDDVGLTYDELEAKIRNRTYTLKEKIAWVAIGGLRHYAPCAET